MNQILVDCLKIRHPNNGLFHYCLQLGRALVRQADPDRDNLCFYLPDPLKINFGPAHTHLRHRRFHKFWFPRGRAVDIWHSTTQSSRYLPPSARTRMILTIHDLNFLTEAESAPGRVASYLHRIQASIDRSDHIVCISQSTRRMAEEHLRLGGRQADVIYNGCNINEYPSFDAPRHRPGGTFIFTIGTVLPKKNFHVLPCLLRGNDHQLLIAGVVDREYAGTIAAAARLHGVENRVHLLGSVSEEEKCWYYRKCLAFALPSRAEGFGLPVIEAMHYGKPVFLSNLAALPEIGGEAAYYFESFDAAAMQEVFRTGLADYEAAGRSAAIRRHALRYSWDDAAAAYLRLYRQWERR